jgi:PiT family inorganic phosphate transporter
VAGLVAGVLAALALAALLGTSDSPNATAALVSARASGFGWIAAWSVAWHAVGGLLAGIAVARTMTGIARLPASQLRLGLAVACGVAVVFTWLTTRRGIPTSASVGLVGSLAGVGTVSGGFRAVDWGELHGLRLGGVGGVLAGIVLAPVLGALGTALVARLGRPITYRLDRRAARPLRGGIWLASAAVALADGSNDGQKAMGVLALVVSGAGALAPGGVGISLAARLSCSLVLALFTVVSGRRVVATVSRGLGRTGLVEDVFAQATSAGVIFSAAALGLPLSTSTVVTSAMVGAEMSAHRRHVRWQGVTRIVAVWAITVPACALASAAAFALARAVGA